MTGVNIHRLANGIIFCHKQVNTTKICHCGYSFNIGSRDEKPEEQGLAHFWEHMAFKGTEKRKAYHIINRLEVVGGELNAYTTKEKVYLYSSVLDKHFDRACELLTDISFNSVFPEKEIAKEKGVILEEMSMYEDSPEDSIFDEFDELVFPNHSLGRNILGTRESVNSFSQKDFYNFLENNWGSNEVIFSSVSSLPFAKALKTVQKHLEKIDLPEKIKVRNTPVFNKGEHKTIYKPIQQSHMMLGVQAPKILHSDRIPFFMLSYLLGGPIMGSRLNLSLREKYGLVYSVESNFNSFSDTGMFSIYFGTDKNKVEKAMSLVLKEIAKVKTKELGVLQLSKLKDQICANLAMAEEGNSSFMQMMGKSVLDTGKIDTLSEIFKHINDVDASQFLEIANKYFDKDHFSSLTYISE